VRNSPVRAHAGAARMTAQPHLTTLIVAAVIAAGALHAVWNAWALTAIGPTTAPRPNANATATAQAGKRDIRLAEDQICRVTAHLHVVM
jgi:hypothetical protein